jgi:hypothetical protein
MDGLWELPPLDAGRALPGDRGSGRRQPRLRLRPLRPVASFRHSITYRRLRVEVVRATLLAEPPDGAYRWVRLDRARRLPASSMVAKALAGLGRAPGRTSPGTRASGTARFD